MSHHADLLKEAKAAVDLMEDKYQDASFDDKVDLKPERDKILNAYRAARDKLIAQSVVCTEDDVLEMQKLREEIQQAAAKQALLSGFLKVAGLLAKFAL
jgi:hypothetical protein